MTQLINRRTFHKQAAAMSALAALPSTHVSALGSNERVRLGVIGVGNRGDQLLDALLVHKDCEIVALCDVYEPYLDAAQKKVGGKATLYHDFRKLIEQKDLDAVVIVPAGAEADALAEKEPPQIVLKLDRSRTSTSFVEGKVTQRSVLDALEARYPMLRGTIRDHVTQQRRAFLRFFACEQDLSHESPDAPLPEAVATGIEPFLIVGAMAGG